jgi:hypothetical protein
MRLEPVVVWMLSAVAYAATALPPVTFTRDVAPILEKHCQACHRPGEAAPFSLLTYEQARPWAKAMKEAVRLKKMPPWFADPHYGKFSNDQSLAGKDVDAIAAWADAGAPEGDRKDMPPSLTFLEGWSIPKPDLVFQPKAFQIPASGTIEYQKIIVPTGFTEDKWVQFAEARPGDRARIHHMIAFIREPGSKWLRGAKPGEFFVAPKPAEGESVDTSALPSDFLVGYAPGQPPEILPPGQAKLIKAGSDLVLEIHYTTNGTASTDHESKFGLVFAREAPKERVLTLSATNGKFKIPAGAANYRVDSDFELGTAVKLASLHPHMHGRGKDFEYRIVYPTGETQTLLRVPRYNWQWQLWYILAQPLDLPKGSKIECTAHFDNSANNPDNADPTKEVGWGDQSWDEMMVGFFNLVFDASTPVRDIFPAPATTARH